MPGSRGGTGHFACRLIMVRLEYLYRPPLPSVNMITRPPDTSAYWKVILNICCVYSKEPSQSDGSFEHPKHMFKLMGKKIIKNLRK